MSHQAAEDDTAAAWPLPEHAGNLDHVMRAPLWAFEDDRGQVEEHREPTLLDRMRARLLSSDALDELPPPEWLIDGIFVKNTLAVVYGRPGAGKSFLALDFALSIATGTWWCGRQVAPGRVLYVAAEGAGGLSQRKLAWQRHKNVLTVERITWLPMAVNLLDIAQSEALASLSAEMKPGLAAPTVKPALVVIDTLARCLVGGDENSAEVFPRNAVGSLRHVGTPPMCVRPAPRPVSSARGASG